MRITRGRKNILSVLFQAGTPLSLKEIYERVATYESAPDYTTVFRMVSLLENLHVVEKVNLQRDCSYYELRNPDEHYDHLICTYCGKVQRLDLPCPLKSFEKQLQKSFGFQINAHSLEFFGRCQDCTS